MTRYHCSSCEIEFESDETRPRCPSCMRVSTVEEPEEKAGSRRWLPAVIGAVALILAGSAGIAAWNYWPASGDSTEPTAESPDFPDQSALDEQARANQQTVDLDEEVATAAEAILLDRTGMDAVYALSSFMQGQMASRTLIVLGEARARRRPPLSADTLSDGTLTSLAAREGAHLYPLEITMLASALLKEAEVPHQLVLLDPVEPTINRFPVAAIKVEDDLVLDPASGLLRRVPGQQVYGTELLWAQHALLGARQALDAGDLNRASRLTARGRKLLPSLWISRALQAEIAVQRGDLESARAAASGLAADGDHPYAWLVEVQVEVAGRSDAERAELQVEGLERVVEAFPFEAGLAVELGRQLAAANRFEEARDAFELSLMRSSDVRGARTGLARLYAATDPERAMKFLRDELAEHPAFAEAYLVMGWLHMMYGAESDADRALERGRQVASDKAAFDEEADELLSRLQD